jgi:hypothetical protein
MATAAAIAVAAVLGAAARTPPRHGTRGKSVAAHVRRAKVAVKAIGNRNLRRSWLSALRPTLIVGGEFAGRAGAFHGGNGATLGLRLRLTRRFSVEPAFSVAWHAPLCEELLLGAPGCETPPRPLLPEREITGALVYRPVSWHGLAPFVEAGGGWILGADVQPAGDPHGLLFLGGGASLPTGLWRLRLRPEVRVFLHKPAESPRAAVALGLSWTF